MQLKHIVVAVDDSGVGRHALVEALGLAARTGAQVTAMTAVAARPMPTASAAQSAALIARTRELAPALSDLKARVQSAIPSGNRGIAVSSEVAYGIPGIEICRFADERGADLLVMGRKRRSQAERLLVGDTADAVARRSRVPCLFVPQESAISGAVLAAVDGGVRAPRVVRAAYDFAAATRAPLRLITVDPVSGPEPADLQELLASERRLRLRETLRAAVPEAGDRADEVELIVRRGDTVQRVLEAAEGGWAGVLVVGYRRGGPPGVAELGSVARRLAHGAARPVLTVPL